MVQAHLGSVGFMMRPQRLLPMVCCVSLLHDSHPMVHPCENQTGKQKKGRVSSQREKREQVPLGVRAYGKLGRQMSGSRVCTQFLSGCRTNIHSVARGIFRR